MIRPDSDNLYICSLFHKIICPVHGVKYMDRMWKYENLVCIYQKESKGMFIFSSTFFLPQNGTMMEKTINFSAALKSQV